MLSARLVHMDVHVNKPRGHDSMAIIINVFQVSVQCGCFSFQ